MQIVEIATRKKENLISAAEATDSARLWWSLFLENISIIFKSSGLLVWCFIFLLTILEVKQYYNIDLIPGYNSAVDDAYGAVKGSISEFFK